MILLGHNDFVGAWAGRQLGTVFDSRTGYQTMGIVRDGRLVAAVVFTFYKKADAQGPGCIEGTISSTDPRWCTKRHLAAIFDYAFNQAKCYRFIAVTESTNQRARAFLLKLGFLEEGTLRGHYWSGDGILYAMTRDECRWLREERASGQGPQSASRA